MDGFSWWNVVPSTVGGLVGGGFAVLGMLLTARRDRVRVKEQRNHDALAKVRDAGRQLFLALRSGPVESGTSARLDDALWELGQGASAVSEPAVERRLGQICDCLIKTIAGPQPAGARPRRDTQGYLVIQLEVTARKAQQCDPLGDVPDRLQELFRLYDLQERES
jgi:hypothetical protein